MSYQLRIDEMLQALRHANSPEASKAEALAVAAADAIGAILRDQFKVESGRANHDLGETMIPFFAAEPGQQLPEAMQGFDAAGEFDFVDVGGKPDHAPAFEVSILWGQAHEKGDEAKTYQFNTQAELDAFMEGVSEMDGWMAYETVEKGYVWRGDDEDEDESEGE